MKDANKILSQSNNLDPEDFCDEVYAIASSVGKPESALINKRYKLNDRYRLAYVVLYSLLHRERHYGVADAKTKPVTTAIVVTPENSYYGLLGVNENASSKEIEIAYQKRIKSLDTNKLEKSLRSQGLSDYEIRSRLEKARQEYKNLNEAYAGVGNEENRKHYDEFKNKYQKGGGSLYKNTFPTEHARNWEILGVSPNPTQLELRSAYRNKVRELHPDAFLAQLGKKRENLTPEEIKILNEREEKLREVNLAYEKEFKQTQLSKEVEEKRKMEKDIATDKQKNIVIETTPTVLETNTSIKELKRTEKFRHTIEQAENINITPEETAELKSRGVVPDNANSSEISANATTAVNLHAKGVGADKFSEAIDTAVDTNILTQEQGTSLQGAAFTLKAIEIENPTLTKSLSIGNQEPNVSILQLPANVSTPQPNQIFLQNQGGGENYFQPFLEGIVDKGKDIVEGKVEKAIIGGLEKKGVTTAAKSATKKVAVQALKKGGEQVVKQGAKVAAKAGLKTGIKAALVAAGAPTGGTSLLIWLAVEAFELVLKLAKKLLGGLLKFITGKDDLKSQLKELAGIGFAISVFTGSVGGVIVTGGGFLLLSGTGSIVGAITGLISAFIIGVTTIVLAISAPVIISIFVFLFLVIFITVIINNSAFVVPYGGYNAPVPGTTVVNPYIEVTKTAESISPPKNPASYQAYENGNLPLTVTYAITITAQRETLTNVTIGYDCNVTKDNPPNPNCPPDPTIPPPPSEQIDIGTPYTFSYTMNYESGTYEDSLVVDTITVTADTASAASQTGSATAILCIGDCPQDCPAGWPVGPENGETQLQVTQGPYATASHTILDAIDITNFDSPNYYSFNGHTIRATHEGLFCAPGGEIDRYGNVVYIVGRCNGQLFATVYAHIVSGSALVPSGSYVHAGESIALTDDTGGWDFPHLHYGFENAGGDGTTCSGFWAQPRGVPPDMTDIYGVPEGCFWNCGVTIP